MSPTMIFDKNGNIHSLTGSPGGTSIIGYVAKSIIGLIDWEMSPQEAINVPHYMREQTELEKDTELEKIKEILINKGHEVSIKRKKKRSSCG